MSMQSLKKIGQKLLKLESGNEALTNGWMDTQVVWRVQHNTLPLLMTKLTKWKSDKN